MKIRTNSNRQLLRNRKISDRREHGVAYLCKHFYEGSFCMKKNDARVRYTQKVLKDSLLQLLEKKPINKITVKEVCELAELNRATFYAHYTDCLDLLESIENEMLGGFEESLKYIRSLDVTSLMSAIYEVIERNDNACRVLVFHGCDHKILGKMIDIAREKSIDYWRGELKRATEAELDMLYIHLSNGLLHVVVDGYGKYSREELSGFINKIVVSTLRLFR